ncbi:hypothetical protein SSX86_025854 [Deinandra increscens subsp. villosa]|uniref:Exocyst subunit Exo70 family protein n=1 Tax=Deinandra increscens subsp. villosa TaxID=3103831 RepID=A0AAP0CE38_9ASTR
MEMEHLIHSRDVLNASLHQSVQIHSEIDKTCTNLSRLHRSFPSLETALKNMASTFPVPDHVHRALPTVSAVLTVYQLVDELGTLVSAHSSNLDDLTLYISLVKRFRQALTLLTSTCRLAILWVQDLQHTTDHLNVRKTLRLLRRLHETEECCLLDQGTLGIALRVLEHEFTNLLVQNSLPVQPPSSLFSSGDDESDVSSDPPQCVSLPFESLKAIIACFSACDKKQVDRCLAIYVKVRTSTVETSLQGLDLDYLNISLSEFDSAQDVEGYIDEWGRHLEFVVKHLLQVEYAFCHQVFGRLDDDVWMDCFSKIALKSGKLQGFIRFGDTITKAKKEAIKLFRLLDVFAALNNLRHDFNRFFNRKHCSEIQTQTRDLIKKVVNGTAELFHELSAQVQLQRLTDPPPDGTVPKLVSFVTEYSQELLDDDYRSVLDQVLEIQSSWSNADNKGLVSVEVRNILRSLELNLETWAKRYEDTSLCCIFIMNTSFYLSKHLKDTSLGDLMGKSWLKRHEDRVEYYTQLYLRESWEKIVPLLTKNDKTDVKNRIKGFTEAFDKEYRKQSGWVLCDNSLRWKTCQRIVEVIVPVYKTLVEGRYVKYSSEKVENMVTSMLQPKYGSNTNMMDRIMSVVSGRFSPTTAGA